MSVNHVNSMITANTNITKKLKSKLSTNKVELVIEEEDNIRFIKQELRKDILSNMLLNTHLIATQLYDLIMTDNNSSPSDPRKGDIFESLCEILLITKCISGLNYTSMMEGRLPSPLIKVSNIKRFINKSTPRWKHF